MKKLLCILSLLLLLVPQVTYGYVPNQPIHWGFKKAVDEQPPDAGAEYEKVIGKYGAFYKGDPNSKILYLTFDNGYEAGYTGKVLDVLKRKKFRQLSL